MNFLENHDHIVATIGSIIFITLALFYWKMLPENIGKIFFPETKLSFLIFLILGVMVIVMGYLFKKFIYYFN